MFLARTRRYLTLIAVVILFLQGCSTAPIRRVLYGSETPSTEPRGGAAAEKQRRESAPWNLWSYGRLVDDSRAKDKGLLQADSLHEKGDLKKALDEYQRLMKKKLTPVERESIGVRVAGTQLMLGNSRDALTTVSRLYGGQGIDQVHPFFAIILAYAYAQQNDLNQSIAWFVQFQKLMGSRDEYRETAKNGVKKVLRNASPQSFESLSIAWSQDPLAGPLIGEERKLRARGLAPGVSAEVAVVPPAGEMPGAAAPGEGGILKVGILLPLSGENASFGKKTKEGIDLAVNANNQGNIIQLIDKDSGSSTQQTEAAVSSLALADGAQIVIGPLLSSQAPVAADAARLRGMPMITFSKNNSFNPGGGVYRLGATSRSQMESLVDAAVNQGRMTRLALIYPETPVGTEFADEFRRALRAVNLEPVFDKSYTGGQDSILMSLAEEAANADPQGIFCPDNIETAARFFMNIPDPVRARVSPLGTAAWDESRQLKNSATALDGAIFPTVFFSQSSSPAVQKFVESYRATYNTAPDLLSAQGFDAAMLTVTVAQSGARDRQGIQGALESISSYSGLTGMLSVLPSGEIQRKYVVLVLSHGKVSEFVSNEAMLRELQKRREIFQPTQPALDTPDIIRSY